MKKIIVLFFMIFCISMTVCAEAPFSEPNQRTDVRYRLFPTQNMWTFLKLDTMTGKIWQVQFSVTSSEYRFETSLNIIDICEAYKKNKIVGRYTLYPTQNTYNFVMLDQIDGETYQVQWSMDAENRVVVPISD